jgi:hypothetical protein
MFERRRKHDRRSGGRSRSSIGTTESAREHIRNAIQMFRRHGDGEPQSDWPGTADAAVSRLTRALAELEAGRA